MHEPSYGVVRQKEAVDLLPHQHLRLAPQHTSQVGLQLVEDPLHLPPLVVEHCEIAGRRHMGVEDRGDKPV